MAGDEGHEGNEGRTPCRSGRSLTHIFHSKRIVAHSSVRELCQDFLVCVEEVLQFSLLHGIHALWLVLVVAANVFHLRRFLFLFLGGGMLAKTEGQRVVVAVWSILFLALHRPM